LRYHTKALFAMLCAVIMLVAYLGFNSWFNLALPAGGMMGNLSSGMSLPNGMQMPEGFSLPQGFTPPFANTNTQGSGQDTTAPTNSGGFQPPAAMQSQMMNMMSSLIPACTLRILVIISAVATLAVSLISFVRPYWKNIAMGVTFGLGVLSLAYFIAFYAQDSIGILPIKFANMVNIGHWLALVATLGLFVQAFIPQKNAAFEGIGDVRQVVASTAKRSGLSLTQNLRVAVEALLANKLRSGLTMLGVIIGVASLVSLVSIGTGATASITSQIASNGVNQLTISSGSGGGFGPRAAVAGAGNSNNADPLTFANAETIKESVANLTYVLPQFSSTLTVRSDQETAQYTVLGTVSDYAIAQEIVVELGEYFDEGAYDTDARVAVLGADVAEDLFGGVNPLGEIIRIDGKRFEVLGVLEEQDGGIGQDPNSQIYVPLSSGYRYLFNARISGSRDYRVSNIIAVVDNTDNVTTVTSNITTVLRDARDLTDDEDDDFSVFDQGSLLDTVSSVTGILTVLLGAIASISLVVGGIGIMNIMLVSVTERTKEIGLRKAIGARRGHILQQFLIETIFLSVLGGIIGVGLGVLVSFAVDASGAFNTSVSVESIFLGLGFSMLVGVFFGVYPANAAASLEPIEALRYE
jgi:putative ABC transport system permease protein